MCSSSRIASRTVAKMATIEGAAAVRTAELEPAPSAVRVGRSTVVSDAEDIPTRDKKKQETTEKQIQTRLVSKLSIMWLQQHIHTVYSFTLAITWPVAPPALALFNLNKYNIIKVKSTRLSHYRGVWLC